MKKIGKKTVESATEALLDAKSLYMYMFCNFTSFRIFNLMHNHKETS